MDNILYIPIGHQGRAKGKGAIFERKSFFLNTPSRFIISDGLDEDKARKLQEAYGEGNLSARKATKALLIEWEKVLANGDHFDLLRMAKHRGLPKDDRLMAKLFLRLADKDHGDYPISWEHLRTYLPEFDKIFGIDRYLTLHRTYDLNGDMALSIKESQMPTVDKCFLYFVYEINSKKRGYNR